MRIEQPMPVGFEQSRRTVAIGAVAAVVGLVLLVLAINWQVTRSMIEIWARATEFEHCYVVLPVFAWMVWTERHRLARTPATPFWPGLVLCAIAAALGLVGEAGGALVVSHFALVGLAVAAVVTAFGLAWARILIFPLGFLFFAVPFGEALVPKLMDWTADVTVLALRATGVLVYREGTHFTLSSGRWSVIEACSGLKFLIASFMSGTLYAWLMYRSPRKRLLFIGASLIVPILANWLRAYSIVLIGHLTNNTMMTGEDHIVFGWILFGAVMALFFWVGARWRDDGVDVERLPRASDALEPGWQPAAPQVVAAACVLALVLAWPLAASAVVRGAPVVNARPAVIAPANGWTPTDQPAARWTPDLVEPTATRVQSFTKDGRTVDVHFGVFANQRKGAEMATAGNEFVHTTNNAWKQVARGRADVVSPATPAAVRTGAIRIPLASTTFDVWQWYWTGSGPTASDLQGKLALVRARLARAPDTGVWVALTTHAAPLPPGEVPGGGEPVLREFLQDMGPSLAAALQDTVTH